MRAVCISNTPASLEQDAMRAAYSRNYHVDEAGVQVGREYEIYGVVFRDADGLPWFLVAEEDDDEYPKAHLAAFFRLIDHRIPSGWSYSGPNNIGDVSFLPERWASDPSFMEKLVNGDPYAIAYFSELKAQQRPSIPG